MRSSRAGGRCIALPALLYRIAGVALIPIQAAVFILWPPPTSVIDYFGTFEQNLVLGLLDLDLLLILDQVLIVVVLLGLYALCGTGCVVDAVATTLGLIGASCSSSRARPLSVWCG